MKTWLSWKRSNNGTLPERAPCYFYRTNRGLEIDLLIDQGVHFDVFEIKFSANPSIQMARSLVKFKEEFSVKKAVVLNLRQQRLPLSKGVVAEHWSHLVNLKGDSAS